MANSLSSLVYAVGNRLLYVPLLTGASGKGRPIWDDEDPVAKTRKRRRNLRDRERENRLTNPFSYTGLTIRFIALCLVLAASAAIQVRYSLDFTSLSVLRPWFLACTGINDQTGGVMSLLFSCVSVPSLSWFRRSSSRPPVDPGLCTCSSSPPRCIWAHSWVSSQPTPF